MDLTSENHGTWDAVTVFLCSRDFDILRELRRNSFVKRPENILILALHVNWREYTSMTACCSVQRVSNVFLRSLRLMSVSAPSRRVGGRVTATGSLLPRFRLREIQNEGCYCG